MSKVTEIISDLVNVETLTSPIQAKLDTKASLTGVETLTNKTVSGRFLDKTTTNAAAIGMTEEQVDALFVAASKL